jgi:hypothetical protein
MKMMLFLLAAETTWAPKDFDCPMCKTKNTFMVIMSYGSYIYSWPSKFQYIFWPLTDKNVVYSCRSCRLSCLMWDFEKIPKDKFEKIREALKDAKLDANDDYAEIPMSQRLAAAEKVYALLDRDEEFWCQFYRVQGYHLEREKKDEQAAAARKKALEIAVKLADQKENEGIRKRFLLISGSMKYFCKDVEGALKDLKAASALKYVDKEKKDESDGLDGYLGEVLKEFVRKIEAKEPLEPRAPDEHD